MCGRVIQSSEPLAFAIVDGMDVRDSRLHNHPPRWNAAPSQELLVIRRNHKSGEVSLDPLRWGLIPNWCNDPQGGRKPINAECETVHTLPTFRDAYRSRRCILPVDVCIPQIPSAWPEGPNRAIILPMRALLNLIRWMLLGLVRSRTSIEAENVALRHQLSVLCRSATKRPVLRMSDRLVFILLYRLAPPILNAVTIMRPETIVRWHRAGFRSFWRWKSRRRAGRPSVAPEIRRLIREMSLANPLWGAPRIHGELLKLGIDVGQTSVAKSMARRRRPPSQGWRTFLLNHADGIASIDLFVVPTISFRSLYGLLVLGHGRRRILSLAATVHPTAEWVAQQVTEACGWDVAPQYLIRDRDRAYGDAFTRRIRAMGIRDRPTAPRSPWQNGYAERLIGSIRRECLDHVIVFCERHLRHVLRSYAEYYNAARRIFP